MICSLAAGAEARYRVMAGVSISSSRLGPASAVGGPEEWRVRVRPLPGHLPAPPAAAAAAPTGPLRESAASPGHARPGRRCPGARSPHQSVAWRGRLAARANPGPATQAAIPLQLIGLEGSSKWSGVHGGRASSPAGLREERRVGTPAQCATILTKALLNIVICTPHDAVVHDTPRPLLLPRHRGLEAFQPADDAAPLSAPGARCTGSSARLPVRTRRGSKPIPRPAYQCWR